MKKHIAVLMGGISAEREVSLVSGAACAKALNELGYKVTEIDVGHDIATKLAELKPDIAFNALHGRFGEDGCIQGILEYLRIPYTHSGVLASAIAMDKPMAKQIFAAHGLRCPEGKIMTRAELLASEPMPRPYVVKPANEGSSVGVSIVTEGSNFDAAALAEDTPWLVERYIHGRELTVAVLDGKALAVTELRVPNGFYDYDNKYKDGRTEHLCPAPLPDDVRDAIMQMAEKAHDVLGCSGLSRSDFRYDDAWSGERGLYLLEINTQPGMTGLSLAPEQAKLVGISFNELVDKLVKLARLHG